MNMNMDIVDWRIMPSHWMLNSEHSLSSLKWAGKGYGSANTAALMVYYILCLYASERDNPITKLGAGEAEATYNELEKATGISRNKVWEGIDVLKKMNLIEISSTKTRNNIYRIVGYKEIPWCKIPLRKFVKNKAIVDVFCDFSLRKKTSLHAMKIYFLILYFRSNQTNYASISYDKISQYLGITKSDIRPALSLLQHAKFTLLDRINSPNNLSRYRHNIYWVSGIDSRKNFSTLKSEIIENDLICNKHISPDVINYLDPVQY